MLAAAACASPGRRAGEKQDWTFVGGESAEERDKRDCVAASGVVAGAEVVVVGVALCGRLESVRVGEERSGE